jgi:hypothetical protein
MRLFWESAGVLAGVALVATLSGRLLLAVFRVAWLRHRSVERDLVAGVIGTLAWMLVGGWCSFLTLTAPQTLTVCGAAVMALAIGVTARWGYGWLLLPRPTRAGLVLFTLMAASCWFLLLPVFTDGAFCFFNDAFTCLSLSKWLQGHGFGTPCALDPRQPLTVAVALYQRQHLRMGSAFVLALMEAAFPRPGGMGAYLATSAWGLVLNLAGVYLVCRWALRLPRAYAVAAVAFLGLLENPLFFSLRNGFLPQTYGTALLLFSVAMLSRLRPPTCWRWGSGVLAGMVGAGAASAYSEILPVVVAVFTWHALGMTLRSWRRARLRRWAGFAAGTVCCLLLLGNHEWYRALAAIRLQLGTVVPIHIPYSPAEYLAFAMGLMPFRSSSVSQPLTMALAAGTATAAVVVLVGMLWRGLAPRGRHALVPLALMLALVAYFARIAIDPLTHHTGHTWSVLKLCKWAFPLVVAFLFAGWYVLLRRLPGHRLIVTASLAGLLCVTAPAAYERCRGEGHRMQELANSSEPLADWARLGRAIDRLGFHQVYLVSEPVGVFPRCAVAYFLYPRPMLNGWKNSWFETAGTEDLPEWFATDTATIMWGRPPFDEPRGVLGGGLSLLHTDRPVIFHYESPNWGVEHAGPGASATWLGNATTRLHCWSPRPCTVEVAWQAHPGHGLPSSPDRCIEVVPPTGEPRTLTMHGSATLALRLELPAGVSSVALRCLDRTDVPDEFDKAQPSRFLVRVVNLSLHEVRTDMASTIPGHPVAGGTCGNCAAISEPALLRNCLKRIGGIVPF